MDHGQLCLHDVVGSIIGRTHGYIEHSQNETRGPHLRPTNTRTRKRTWLDDIRKKLIWVINIGTTKLCQYILTKN